MSLRRISTGRVSEILSYSLASDLEEFDSLLLLGEEDCLFLLGVEDYLLFSSSNDDELSFFLVPLFPLVFPWDF